LKYLVIFRSVVIFGLGFAILSALISISYSELLLDFSGIETEIKVVKVDLDVNCGSRKVKRSCNRFTLDIFGKSVVYSSDYSQLYESKLTFLEGREHIFKIGGRNKEPLNALFNKAFNVFPAIEFLLGVYNVISGFIGLKSNIKNTTVKYSLMSGIMAASIYLGLNILDFFT